MSERSVSPGSGPDRPAPPPPARPRDDAAAGSGGEADGDRAAEPTAGSVTDETAARIAELADQRLRALADLDNARKKCASQVSRTEAETRARVARLWLPVVDNLELALQHAAADPGSIVEGIKAIREQALGVLAQLGFARRDDLGTRFDPKQHEAVASRADPDAPDGSIVEVVRPGYGENESQLRPAQVVVAKAD
ncbi:MAG: nucleotide exchange factor GrpE [Streptosporangiaceae bacterium]